MSPTVRQQAANIRISVADAKKTPDSVGRSYIGFGT